MKFGLSVLAISLLVALAAHSAANAQDKEWRPVTSEELQLRIPKVDPDADAEAIFWEVRIDDSSYEDLSMKHYVRLKIYTERGREKYGRVDIPYLKKTKIKDIGVRVIKTDGSIVEIPSAEILDREIIRGNGLKIRAKSFVVPNVEPGVIIEYRYKEKFEDAGAWGLRLDFQRDLPIWNLNYYYKPQFKFPPIYSRYNFSDTNFLADQNGYFLASRANIPAFKEEPYMPPDDMVRPWMRLGLAYSPISGWRLREELAKYLKKDPSDMKKNAVEIAAGASTDEEKLRKFYEYCQSQIANTTWDPSITDEGRKKLPQNKSLKDVLKRRTGTAFDVDTLFAGLAIAAGMDARIAFIGDRSRMFTNAKNPNQEFLRPGAIGVKIDGRWRFFNPGTKFLPFGKLVWYEEGTAAEVASETQFEWVQTPLSDYEYSATNRTGKFTLLADGTLEGEIAIEINGHPAINYRNNNYDETPETREKLLRDDVKRRMSNAEVLSVTIENLTDINKPLTQRYKVKVPNYAQKTGKRLFLQPGFFEYGVPTVFSRSTRKHDIYFLYPWSESDNIEITWPEGFEIENAEPPAVMTDVKKMSSLDVKISTDLVNRVMTYKRKFYFGGGGNILFGAAAYMPLKTLFDGFHRADSHTVIFKQK